MTYVKWGDDLYWRHTDKPLEVSALINKPVLPSSSSKRPEIPFIIDRKFKEADKIIEKTEKQEDVDHAKREKERKKVAKAKKPKKKGWFS